MTTIETKAEWVFDELPKKDGEYLCMLGYNEDQLEPRGIAYTVKYGWNTHHPSSDDKEEPVGWPAWDGYLHCWLRPASIPTWEEIRKAEVEADVLSVPYED